METLLGLLMLVWGLYLFNKEIRNDRERIHKFNAIWKYHSNGFIYALLIGGALLLIRGLIIWIM
jgi:hypothetical protein